MDKQNTVAMKCRYQMPKDTTGTAALWVSLSEKNRSIQNRRTCFKLDGGYSGWRKAMINHVRLHPFWVKRTPVGIHRKMG